MRFLPLLLVALLFSCSKNAVAPDDTCGEGPACAAGQICHEAQCFDLCNADTDCPSPVACIGDLCRGDLDPRQDPVISGVDGDSGNPDVFHRALLIHGQNLDGAAVTLTRGADSIALDVVSNSGTQMEALLPTSLVADDYVMEVVNSAGSDQTEIRILQGEQGLEGPPGSYIIGAGLIEDGDNLSVAFGTTEGTVAAGDDPRFHAAYTDEMAQRALRNSPVTFFAEENLFGDTLFQDDALWFQLPNTQTQPLPGYPTLLTPSYAGLTTYTGLVHVSVETTEPSTCYDWAISEQFAINPARAYEFSIWIRSTDITLNNYFGFYAYDSTGTRIVSEWDNPYFKGSENDTTSWTRWSGFILPATVPDADANGRPDTQPFQSNGADWRWPASAVSVAIRFGACYGDGSGADTSYFALPSVREVTF